MKMTLSFSLLALLSVSIVSAMDQENLAPANGVQKIGPGSHRLVNGKLRTVSPRSAILQEENKNAQDLKEASESLALFATRSRKDLEVAATLLELRKKAINFNQ